MIDPSFNNLASKVPGGGVSPGGVGGAGRKPPQTSFSDMLKQNIDEVARLQQDASRAVQDLATGKTQNVTGVMTAMEKADMAFKTLLAIRGKLMDAYDEVKNISV